MWSECDIPKEDLSILAAHDIIPCVGSRQNATGEDAPMNRAGRSRSVQSNVHATYALVGTQRADLEAGGVLEYSNFKGQVSVGMNAK